MAVAAVRTREETWKQIVELEPRVGLLYEEAARLGGEGETEWTERFWYYDMKKRLSALVGWDAKVGKLSSCWAYEVAYQKIYNALTEG